MVTNIVWWAAILLEALILLRGSLSGLLKKYTLFYSYLACVLTKEFIGVWSYYFLPNAYERLYWPCELLTILASYGVIIEIFRRALVNHQGIAKLSQTLLLLVLAAALSIASIELLQGENATLSGAIAQIGRDVRYVEAAVLATMLFLLARYRISLGPNLLGLIAGYSFWLALNLITLALWFLPGNEVSIVLRTLLPVTYVISLGIWCVSLWSVRSEPAAPSDDSIERDYEIIAGWTKAALSKLSARLTRNSEL